MHGGANESQIYDILKHEKVSGVAIIIIALFLIREKNFKFNDLDEGNTQFLRSSTQNINFKQVLFQ